MLSESNLPPPTQAATLSIQPIKSLQSLLSLRSVVRFADLRLRDVRNPWQRANVSRPI